MGVLIFYRKVGTCSPSDTRGQESLNLPGWVRKDDNNPFFLFLKTHPESRNSHKLRCALTFRRDNCYTLSRVPGLSYSNWFGSVSISTCFLSQGRMMKGSSNPVERIVHDRRLFVQRIKKKAPIHSCYVGKSTHAIIVCTNVIHVSKRCCQSSDKLRLSQTNLPPPSTPQVRQNHKGKSSPGSIIGPGSRSTSC